MLTPNRSPDVVLPLGEGIKEVMVWVKEEVFNIDGTMHKYVNHITLDGSVVAIYDPIEYLEYTANRHGDKLRGRIALGFLLERELFNNDELNRNETNVDKN